MNKKDYLNVVSNNNYQRYIKNLPEKERKNIEDKWNSIAYTKKMHFDGKKGNGII